MGTTATSLHVLRPRRTATADLVLDVERAYRKLGFPAHRSRKRPPARRVILAGRDADRFLSIYDSDNDLLDIGDLKELAVLLSKRLQSAVVLTSIYDSDRFEFIVFHRGRQRDAAVSDADGHSGGLRMLAGKQRAKEWLATFGSPLGTVAAVDSAFAESELATWCTSAGLSLERATAIVADFDASPSSEHATLLLGERKQTPAAPRNDAASPQTFELLRDEDHDAAHRLFPSASPVAPGAANMMWYAVTRGPGFSGLRVRPQLAATEGVAITEVGAVAVPFFNGQITTGIVPAKAEFPEFAGRPITEVPTLWEAPGFTVPGLDPESRRSFLIYLRIGVDIPDAGFVTAEPIVETCANAEVAIRLPPLKLAVCRPAWTPLGPTIEERVLASYVNHIRSWAHRADVPEERIRQQIVDAIAHEPSIEWKGPSDNPKTLAQGIAATRDTERQRTDRLSCLLNAPAVALDVAILPGNGEQERAQAHTLLDRWLASIRAEPGTIATVRTQKHATASFSVSKAQWFASIDALAGDKRWGELLSTARDFRTVYVELTPPGHSYPQGGAVFQTSDRLTIARGWAEGEVLNCSLWLIEDSAVHARFGTSGAALGTMFAEWLAGTNALQAWSAHAAWRPDLGGDRSDTELHGTPYEQMALLRGGVDRSAFNARPWAERHLRFVAPTLWLGESLRAKVDMDALARVARIRRAASLTEVVLKDDATLTDLERALAPIRPVLPAGSA